MVEDNDKKLDKIFEDYDRKLQKKREESKLAKQEREELIIEFNSLKDNIIRPVMEKYCIKLTEAGHQCRISEDEYNSQSYEDVKEPVITLFFLPAGYGQHYLSFSMGFRFPSISFRLDMFYKFVRINTSDMLPGRGGSAGPSGTIDCKDIKEEFVENKIMNLIKEVFEK